MRVSEGEKRQVDLEFEPRENRSTLTFPLGHLHWNIFGLPIHYST